MLRSAPQSLWLVFAVLFMAACGGKSRHELNGADSGGSCPPPDPAPPVVPGEPPPNYRCASGTAGVWQELPCNCELWLRSTSPGPVATTISFAYTPADMAPSLTDSAAAVEAEVDFEDGDGSWHDVWSAQPGNGTNFVVGRNGTTTSVRLATTNLTLDAVVLPACARQTAQATVKGPWGVELSLTMNANELDDAGNTVGSSMGSCFQPATHPTPRDWDGSADPGAAGAPQ